MIEKKSRMKVEVFAQILAEEMSEAELKYLDEQDLFDVAEGENIEGFDDDGGYVPVLQAVLNRIEEINSHGDV